MQGLTAVYGQVDVTVVGAQEVGAALQTRVPR